MRCESEPAATLADHPGVRTVRLVAFVGIGLWLVAYQLRVMAFAPHEVLVFSRYVHDVALIALSGLCVWAGWARRADRVAWLLIGAGLLAWTFGEAWYTVVLWDLKTVPVPSLADAGYLAFPPLAATGLVLLLRRGGVAGGRRLARCADRGAADRGAQRDDRAGPRRSGTSPAGSLAQGDRAGLSRLRHGADRCPRRRTGRARLARRASSR